MGRQGRRADWAVIPAAFRRAIDDALGAPVVVAVNMPGGFSPGPAARCELADGRRVFVKAGGPELNPDTPRFHRREATMLRLLPPDHPSPALIATVDDGEWIAIATEWIEGRTPSPPLAPADVERLLRLLDRLARAGEGLGGLPGVQPFSSFRHLFGHWGELAGDPPAALDAWSRRHAEHLAVVERDAPEAGSGDTLIHVDYRADNVVFATAGPDHDVVVDWPGAAAGAPWIDLLCLVASLELDGGPPPADVAAAHRLGRAADQEAMTVVLAALTGFLTRQALEPPPQGLPTLRAFQTAQGAILRAWLAGRLGLPAPAA